MKYYVFILVTTCFIALNSISFSQDYNLIDSLENRLETEINDSTRVMTLLHLSDLYRHFDKEHAYERVNSAVELSDKLEMPWLIARSYGQLGFIHKLYNEFSKSVESFHISNKFYKKLRPDSLMLAWNYGQMGESYQNIGKYDSAGFSFEIALEISQNTNNAYLTAQSFHHIGNLHWLQGDFLSASEYYIKSFPIYEQLGDNLSKAYILNSIAILNFEMEKYDQALEYYMDALDIFNEIDDTYGKAMIYLNAGEIHWKKKNYDTAIAYNNRSINIADSIGDLTTIAYCYTNLGIVYYELNDFAKADYNYQKALKIWKEIDGKTGLIYLLNYIGILELEQGKLQEAIATTKECLQISTELGSQDEIRRANETLAKAYAKLGYYEKAYEYHVEFKSINDSIFNKEASQKLTSIETQFELEKQQHKLDMQESQLELQNAKLEQHATLQKFMIALIAAILIVVGFITYAYIQKRKHNKKIQKQKDALEFANIQLEQQKEEIEAQRDEIEAQRDEIEAQRDMVVGQKEQIEKINTEITDSIEYAEHIQSAILPHVDIRNQLLGEHFIFFKPRDIVSGDFYWLTKVENQTIIAAADCTGHGVPGAFMSMLGVSYLNEIVNNEYITHPGVILRRLRKKVIQALQQKGETGEQRDGMDISLCSIDFDNKILQYSGANNPLYIIRSSEKKAIDDARNIEIDSQILYEIKGDKMPIALYDRMDKFQTHEIQLFEGDCVYLFSDGFADQFGGPLGKKFKYKPFKELLLNNHTKQMEDQHTLIAKTFDEWKTDCEQVDDILVVGIKI